MSVHSLMGLLLTLACIALYARVYVLDKDVSRLCTALSVLARESERGNLLSAFLLVALYDQLSRKAQSEIPQRLYLWAVEQTARARLQHAEKAGQQEPPDLTELAQQIPPSLPG